MLKNAQALLQEPLTSTGLNPFWAKLYIRHDDNNLELSMRNHLLYLRHLLKCISQTFQNSLHLPNALGTPSACIWLISSTIFKKR